MSTWWTVSYVVLWGIVITLIVVVALGRRLGTLHLRLGAGGPPKLDEEGPPLGGTPPPRDGIDLDGNSVTIGGPGRRQLLLFVSPGCMVCGQVLPSVPALARTYGLQAIALSEEDAIETRRELGHDADVEIVTGHAHFDAYSVPGTPYAVVLDETGVVAGKGTVNNLEQLEGLIAAAARRPTDGHEVAGS